MPVGQTVPTNNQTDFLVFFFYKLRDCFNLAEVSQERLPLCVLVVHRISEVGKESSLLTQLRELGNAETLRVKKES